MRQRLLLFALILLAISVPDSSAEGLTNSITGRVKDEAGLAITNLTVVAKNADNFSIQHSVTTDETGAYLISVAPGWWYVELQNFAERNLVAPGFFPPIEVTNSVTIHDFPVYNAPYTIKVSFEDDNGVPVVFDNPLNRHGVNAFGGALGRQIQVSKPFENGQATLRVSPGVWSLNFDLPAGYRRPYKNIQIFDESVAVRFRLERLGTNSISSVFSGQVIDEAGQPLTNGTIRLSGWTSTTNPPPQLLGSDGQFLFNLPADEWRVYFSDTNHLFPNVYFTLNTNQQIQRVIRAPRLDSQINVSWTFPGGAGPQAVSVSGTLQSGGYSYYTSANATNSSQLQLPAFPGKWSLYAFAAGMKSQQRTIIFEQAGPTAPVVFEFQPLPVTPKIIQGQIVDEAGAPLENARISIREGFEFAYLQVGPDGRFNYNSPGGQFDVSFQRLSPIGAFASFTGDDTNNIDFGQVTLPYPTFKGSFKFVDDKGNEIPVPANFTLLLRQGVDRITYDTVAYELNGSLKAYLSPGWWGIQPVTIVPGYAIPQQTTFEATPNFQHTIVVRKLTTPSSPPIVFFTRVPTGRRILTAYSDSSHSIVVETSTDLKNWHHVETRVLSEPYTYFELSELGATNNKPIFVRALTVD